jgi:hypothetical protein
MGAGAGQSACTFMKPFTADRTAGCTLAAQLAHVSQVQVTSRRHQLPTEQL